MAKAKAKESASASEEIPQVEVIRRMGWSRQTAAEWARRRGCPKIDRGGRTLYLWPDFLTWYIEERIASAVDRVKPADLEEAKARKMAAEAELAELQLASERADLIRVGDAAKVWAASAARVRARLVAAPGKEAHRFIGLKRLPEATKALREVVEAVLAELSEGTPADD